MEGAGKGWRRKLQAAAPSDQWSHGAGERRRDCLQQNRFRACDIQSTCQTRQVAPNVRYVEENAFTTTTRGQGYIKISL